MFIIYQYFDARQFLRSRVLMAANYAGHLKSPLTPPDRNKIRDLITTIDLPTDSTKKKLLADAQVTLTDHSFVVDGVTYPGIVIEVSAPYSPLTFNNHFSNNAEITFKVRFARVLS